VPFFYSTLFFSNEAKLDLVSIVNLLIVQNALISDCTIAEEGLEHTEDPMTLMTSCESETGQSSLDKDEEEAVYNMNLNSLSLTELEVDAEGDGNRRELSAARLEVIKLRRRIVQLGGKVPHGELGEDNFAWLNSSSPKFVFYTGHSLTF
jgi:hypothetical protein